ncbi:MAG: 2-succinyl-5-enolpyruvyl-6-hydroxy-3-cyclohexene-1-carboxylate synthase [Muribaculaceae bacterium]|nr:2-succinyl-5-enolpyruvyl-6-hydroxy-3-cyclohexene-1-carboxylate synthase [Muribaculaceae bacterium]
MRPKYYTVERNVQIVISLLKEHGIRRVIASPGTTNMTFIGSIQNDPYFQIWSCVDERSAAYLACGMAAEANEPVVISCTGATASRNYMPGLTEAYYRKLPVLAITSHRGEAKIGHLLDQQIDRRVLPNDIAVEHVTIPMVDTPEDEQYCMIEANKAILALSKDGGGPVHLNMFTRYSSDFSVKELPSVRVIERFTPYDTLPDLPKCKMAVFVGSHKNFTEKQTESIDKFCAAHDTVVFCDHTSGYDGKYRVNYHLVSGQIGYKAKFNNFDLLIHIGEVCGTFHPHGKKVWRVSPDGELRDTFRNLSKIFMMEEEYFFNHYTPREFTPKDTMLLQCKEEYQTVFKLIPELPFGNIWIAQHTMPKLPEGSELHMGIYNSLRSWNFFELPKGVLGKCNVGGFGIDGGMSTMIGASFVRPDKLFFGVFGDLAFFYDMNVLGNRHLQPNIRILLINNARGAEFRLKYHPCSIFGQDADPYLAAAGHFGSQSPDLVKGYAKALGFKYLSASTKEEYKANIEVFTNPNIGDQPILFEVFTDTHEESNALKAMRTIMSDPSTSLLQSSVKFIRTHIGDKPINLAKSILR